MDVAITERRTKSGRGRTRGLAAVAVSAAVLAGQVLAGLLPATPAAAANPPTPVTDPAALVNPFIGTGNGGPVVGQIDTFPGASTPFGMLQWSPDTSPDRTDGGGYYYPDSQSLGLSLTHLSGPGCPVAEDVPILPTTGALPASPAGLQGATEPFSHSDESASPGYYQVGLGSPAVNTQVTTTQRTGLGSFTFPRTAQANLLIKSGDSSMGNSASSVQVASSDTVTGSAAAGHFCGTAGTYQVYFAVQFSRPFSSYGTWNDTAVKPGAAAAASTARPAQPSPAGRPSPLASGTPHVQPNGVANGTEAKGSQPRATAAQASGANTGAWVTFDATTNQTVQAKVAVSYVSTANAMANLAAEDAGWNLNAVSSAAKAAWNTTLKQVEVAGGTAAQQQELYTGLYHAALDPSLFSDANGQYMGFDGKVHTLPAGQAQYTSFSGWDVYRSEIPLIALLDPGRVSQMVSSMLRDEAEGGWLPKWPVAAGYTGVMNGDAADPMIAGAYAFGARGFDLKTALAAMVKGATQVPDQSQLGQGWYEERPGLSGYQSKGYVPNTSASSISPVNNGASETVEYAAADFGVSRIAAAAGDQATQSQFLGRSQNWQNIFNTSNGYLQPRDGSGAFPPGDPLTAGQTNFGQDGFQEGNAAQYNWLVPQDMAGLIAGMGGNSVAVSRLDKFFSQVNSGPNDPYYWAGNEMDLQAPWAYDYVGAPYKTQALIRHLVDTVYANTPGGEPGNDDLGAMSSWLVWAMLGMYPETPGSDALVLGSPVFPREVLHLPGGHDLTVSAPQASDANPYVQSLSVNGKPSESTSISLEAAMSGPGMTLDFTLGSSPDTSWGAAAADAPPSYQAGPLQFPPSTAAALSPSPSAVRMAPGGTTQASVDVDNSRGKDPAQVTWKAAAPSGISVSPSQATVTAPAGGSASTAVSVTAAGSTAPGFYDIGLTGQAQNGAVLAGATLQVTVAQPGTVIPTAFVSNYSSDTVTPIDTANNTAGSPITVGTAPIRSAVTPDGKTAYVTNFSDNTLTPINTSDDSTGKPIPAGSGPAGIAITPDGSTGYVTDYSAGQVTPVNLTTGTAGSPIPVGSGPNGDAITPDGKTVYVANYGSNSVTPISTATGTAGPAIPVGPDPKDVVVSPDGSKVFVSNYGSNTITPINTATGTAGTPITVGASPYDMAFTPDSQYVYVADQGTNAVSVVNTSTGSVTATVTGPFNTPQSVAVTADGSTAYITNVGANNVVPVSVATNQPGSPVPVGPAPDGISVAPPG